MFSLTEDKQIIRDIFERYLNETSISNWKYENALSKVSSQDLMWTDIATDMKSLGELHAECIDNVSSKHHSLTEEEEAKINAVLDIIDEICSAPPIRKILLKCLYKTNMQNEILDQLTEEEEKRAKEEKEKREKKDEEKRYPTMTSIQKFDYLAKYHGNDSVLDLTDVTLPRRYKDIKAMRSDLKLTLQPLVTFEEKGPLIEVATRKNKHDVELLLSKLYQRMELTPHCRYVQFALVSAHEIWSTGLLKTKEHGEDWYRFHVYSSIWDKAFTMDKDFETKRSECISKITTALREIDGTTKLQKVDFILRDINTESDFLSVEEKPSRKGVTAELKKGNLLQKQSPQLWSKEAGSTSLIGELEATTCQWERLKLITSASRLLPSGRILSYTKSMTSMPINHKHCAEFARLLMDVLTIKNLVIHNYEKFNIILNEKYKQDVETLQYREDVPHDIPGEICPV